MSKVKTNKNIPVLNSLGTNLNDLAMRGKIDPVIGRDEEITRIIQILSRRTKNNPIIVGEPGVGKTALAEGLALKIVNKEVNKTLLNKQVFSLNVADLMAGTKFRGELENRIKALVAEVSKQDDIILFIDEIHTLVGAGAGAEDESLDIANMLKPALARGDLQCIGATTLKEYRKYFESDAALTRRFQPLQLKESSVEDTIEILKGVKGIYEDYHKLKISEDIIEHAVKLSDRYIKDRFLPDKAIDVLDEAGASVKLREIEVPEELSIMENELEKIIEDKFLLVQEGRFEEAADLRKQETQLILEIETIRNNIEKEYENREITINDITEVVSKWSGVDVNDLSLDDMERLVNLEEEMHKRVIGQNKAVTAVSRAIRRNKLGLQEEKRPIGSFIFLGPTGVGKTEVARTLAEVLFGNENNMIRLDMSEYMEKYSVSKLIGSAPGYVGHGDGGQLTEKVRSNPYSVILLDEIEKAHPDVFNLLLQVLEDGRLTDSKGRLVDFSHSVIIMTTNLGSHKERFKSKQVGFLLDDKKDEILDEDALNSLKEFFRPEFLNRVDEAIKFHSLEKKHLEQILHLLLEGFKTRIKKLELDLKISDGVVKKVLEDGYDTAYGARPLKRSIQRNIEDLISEEYLKGNIKKGDKVSLNISGGKIVVKKRK